MARLKTQKTELFLLDSTDTGNEVRKVGNVTSLSGIGGTAGEIDVTDFDSTAREILAGLKDNGTVSVSVNWDPQDGSHAAIDALVGADSNRRFVIGCSESAVDPSFSSTFTIPTDRTTLDFDGAVLSFAKDAETDAVWTGTIEIRVSGAITLTPAA